MNKLGRLITGGLILVAAFCLIVLICIVADLLGTGIQTFLLFKRAIVMLGGYVPMPPGVGIFIVGLLSLTVILKAIQVAWPGNTKGKASGIVVVGLIVVTLICLEWDVRRARWFDPETGEPMIKIGWGRDDRPIVSRGAFDSKTGRRLHKATDTDVRWREWLQSGKPLAPISVDPEKVPWFNARAEPELYFSGDEANLLDAHFYQAPPGMSDTATGQKLRAVSPQIREAWSTALASKRELQDREQRGAQKVSTQELIERQKLEALDRIRSNAFLTGVTSNSPFATEITLISNASASSEPLIDSIFRDWRLARRGVAEKNLFKTDFRTSSNFQLLAAGEGTFLREIRAGDFLDMVIALVERTDSLPNPANPALELAHIRWEVAVWDARNVSLLKSFSVSANGKAFTRNAAIIEAANEAGRELKTRFDQELTSCVTQ
jgi:hypothetical protein